MTGVSKAYVEIPVTTRIRVQSCRHLMEKLSCQGCLTTCPKNFISATLQLCGQLVLGVKLASAFCLLRKMFESPCCSPNHLNEDGSTEGIHQLELILRVVREAQHLSHKLLCSSTRRSCGHLPCSVQLQVEGVASRRLQGHKQVVSSIILEGSPALKTTAHPDSWLQQQKESNQEQSEDTQDFSHQVLHDACPSVVVLLEWAGELHHSCSLTLPPQRKRERKYDGMGSEGDIRTWRGDHSPVIIIGKTDSA